MASYYDAVDAAWSWNGDFLLGDQGDIKDTMYDTLQSIVDQVSIICSSSFGDWAIYPSRGAGIDDFVGEANNRTTANKLHDRIRISLTSMGIVNENDLKVNVIPVSMHKLLIVIYIDAISLGSNTLENEGPLKVALVFDTSQRQVFFVKPSAQ